MNDLYTEFHSFPLFCKNEKSRKLHMHTIIPHPKTNTPIFFSLKVKNFYSITIILSSIETLWILIVINKWQHKYVQCILVLIDSYWWLDNLIDVIVKYISRYFHIKIQISKYKYNKTDLLTAIFGTNEHHCLLILGIWITKTSHIW